RSLAALEGLCQRDLELGLEVDARRDARASSGTSAEEILRGESAAAAEERLEEIGEVPETFSVERAAGTGLAPVDPVESTAVPGAARSVLIAGPVRADLVVPAALLGIGEDLVGLVDLLEAPLGLRSSVDVRVVLPGQLPVRPLDLLGRRVLRDAEDLVVVLVLDRHAVPLLVGRRCRRRRPRRLDLRRRQRRLTGREGDLQDVVDLRHGLDLDRLEDLLRDVDEIFLVLLREDEGLDPRAVRGEQLLLHASDGKDAAAERDLAGHRDVAPHATA